MRSSNIEPGLLNVFRWYVAIRLALLAIVAWSNQQEPNPTNPRFPEAGIFFFGVLMVMLLWPYLQQKMGRAFLPVALVLASVGPIAESAANVEGRLEAGLGINDALADYWMPFFLLFVPLLLIAWQYRYRAVIFFCVGTTLLDMGSILPLVERETTDVAALSTLIVARGLLFAFVGLFVVKLVKAQKEARRSLAAHSATLEQLATSRERNRLARELHDTLAHSLSGIAVQLEAVRTIWEEDPDQARGMMERALDDARSGLGEARRAIQTLRASPLEDLGLERALRTLAEGFIERHGIVASTVVAEKLGSLDPEMENAIYRIAEEALTNVARHSAADTVTVALDRKAGRIRLTVADDGRGFDASASAPDGHVGIAGMRERAQLVGGSLDVASSTDGTTVRFEVSPWK